MTKHVLVPIVSVLVSAGCYQRPTPPPPAPQPQAVANSLDITVGGKRYYGLHLDFKSQETGKVLGGTSIVLMPWDERPEVGVVLQGDVSVVTINGSRYEIRGRHVCETDGGGTKLTIYRGEIPIGDYVDRPTLQKKVAGIMAGAEPP